MTSQTAPSGKNFFKPKTYDRLKFVAQIFLPALGALYFGLSQIWHLPKPTEIVGTITVIDLFLGAILGVSSAQYYKNDANFDGSLSLQPKEDGGSRVVFNMEKDPETVIKEFGKRSFEFRVDRSNS